ncbi:hypothetical protein OE847_003744 [Salmonella enterica]|nr:hypothetical protein [Salmonella enterica]EDX0904665.1 hypothetical protein [Salmonella enterica subsp. enterica]EBD7338786.1 hypothetical protein [Salmonella enterica]ECP2052816.1 hypothetical protein [Salmonella enterica]ECX5291066.1 hypothetical protein [Salmonella enterica]
MNENDSHNGNKRLRISFLIFFVTTMIIATHAHGDAFTDSIAFVAGGDRYGNGKYDTSKPGVLTLTVTSPFLCMMKGQHNGLPRCPFTSTPGVGHCISQSVYITSSSQTGKIKTEPDTKAYFAPIGQQARLCFESYDNSSSADKWRSQVLTLKIPVKFVPVNPNEPPGIISDVITSYIVAAPTAPAVPLSSNVWSTLLSFKSPVSYKIKNGEVVPPETPDVSCNVSTTSLTLNHEALKISSATGNTVQQNLSITCDGKASVTLALSNTTNSQAYKDLSMNGITTRIHMSTDSGSTWFANKTVDTNVGTMPFLIQSTLQGATTPGSFTGHDVLTVTYK